MKFCIQVFFTNGTNHNFLIERDDMEEIEDMLISYRDDKHDLVFAGSEEQPCLFNPQNVLLIVASPTVEVKEEEVETICCSEERCQK